MNTRLAEAKSRAWPISVRMLECGGRVRQPVAQEAAQPLVGGALLLRVRGKRQVQGGEQVEPVQRDRRIDQLAVRAGGGDSPAVAQDGEQEQRRDDRE